MVDFDKNKFYKDSRRGSRGIGTKMISKSDETKNYLGYILTNLDLVSNGSYMLRELHSLTGSKKTSSLFSASVR